MKYIEDSNQAGAAFHGNPDHFWRAYLSAGNPAASPALLALMSKDENAKIRRRIAENPGTPETILMELAADPDTEVRLSIAEHPRAPVATLALLARDASPDVRFGLAENPLLPEPVLLALSIDDNPFVATRAWKTLTRLKCSDSAEQASLEWMLPHRLSAMG